MNVCLTKVLSVQQTGCSEQEVPLAPMTVMGEQVTVNLLVIKEKSAVTRFKHTTDLASQTAKDNPKKRKDDCEWSANGAGLYRIKYVSTFEV